MAKKIQQWINIKVTDPELIEQLTAMVEADDSDRSKFIRNLIRQEFLRRQSESGYWIDSSTDPLAIKLISADTAVAA